MLLGTNSKSYGTHASVVVAAHDRGVLERPRQTPAPADARCAAAGLADLPLPTLSATATIATAWLRSVFT
jgi:hypothetical protein